jgi:ribonuclease-3
MASNSHQLLYEVLGHKFSDAHLLSQALTHSSMQKKNYERLEFLGDRVLGLIVAHLIFDAYPEDAEGGLAKRHTSLVRKETLAQIAENIGLNHYIIMAKGEHLSGGRMKQSLLSDVCEAVIAALYLDGGLKAATRFIERYWHTLIHDMVIPPQDSKTIIQEWAQGLGMLPPQYIILKREGPPHEPIFTVEVSIEGLDPISAKGSSKRAAEQEAARLLIAEIAA